MLFLKFGVFWHCWSHLYVYLVLFMLHFIVILRYKYELFDHCSWFGIRTFNSIWDLYFKILGLPWIISVPFGFLFSFDSATFYGYTLIIVCDLGVFGDLHLFLVAFKLDGINFFPSETWSW